MTRSLLLLLLALAGCANEYPLNPNRPTAGGAYAPTAGGGRATTGADVPITCTTSRNGRTTMCW